MIGKILIALAEAIRKFINFYNSAKACYFQNLYSTR